MTPAELLADHRLKPRSIGKLLNAHAVGDVGSIVVGDALRFYIQVADERITAARFQVFNGQDQVAAASVMTELAVGRSLDQALALTSADICAHLGGLDPTALPPRVWAIDGLRVAVAVYRGETVDADEERAPLLCRCHGIPEDTVKQSIAVMGLEQVDDVVRATGAGAGCGSCKADIPRLIDEVRNKPAVSAGSAAAAPVRGRIGLVRRIASAVGMRFAPTLSGRALGVELVDLDGDQVVVRITGGDEQGRRTAAAELEAFLKAEIDKGLGVRLLG
jgi:NifU-like protein